MQQKVCPLLGQRRRGSSAQFSSHVHPLPQVLRQLPSSRAAMARPPPAGFSIPERGSGVPNRGSSVSMAGARRSTPLPCGVRRSLTGAPQGQMVQWRLDPTSLRLDLVLPWSDLARGSLYGVWPPLVAGARSWLPRCGTDCRPVLASGVWPAAATPLAELSPPTMVWSETCLVATAHATSAVSMPRQDADDDSLGMFVPWRR
jgi:hypothetical protein